MLALKYYSNTTRISAIKERDGKKKVQKTSSSFEFTSFWADANNKVIPDLVDFTRTFFQKHTLLNIITKYCVLTSENLLLVMRPYQIVATERILNRIEIATNYKKMGSTDAGGYIWHTTGSGKTLTSFAGKDLAGKDLVCICYNPYFNKNCEEYVKWIANKEKIQEAYEWRNKIRKMYPQAYQSYSEYNHKEASEFRIRLKEYDKNRRAQANSQTYRGPSSNSIDWEKAATGTAIFGPTGAALGMMDDEDKH